MQQELPSPDGRFIAAVYYELGPAYAGDRTCVSVRKVSEPFDNGNGPVLLYLDGRHNVALAWRGPASLALSYDVSQSEVLGKRALWNDVAVTFHDGQ